MNNFKIPKIRFMNFNDKWNYKTLDEISNSIEYGINAPAKDFDGNHKYLRITDIDDTSRLFITEKLSSPDINFTAGDYENYKLQKNDLLFARTGASVGKTYLYRKIDGKVYYAGFLIRARLHDSYDGNFVFQQTLTDKYKRFIEITSQRSGQPGVNGKEYGEWKIGMTSYDEQTAIGSLFRTLDDLLASYKDNLANYQSLKATMLSKMFPKAGETVPEIRLDGFEGEWVEKRLKDISKRVTRKNNDLVSERALTISAQFGLIDQEEFFQKKIASKDVSGYYLIKKGEFAYNKSYSTGYPLGAIKRLDKYENGVLSTLYILFKAVDVDSDYLAHYYESDKWHREVSMCAAEGARNHGLLNIAPADFFNTRLVIPKELEEQQAIGSYFSNLDNLINSHQEKISQLETLKKKLLQDMFI
ncbi:restriction endonuclease subunit S [Streptococcus gordonii]|uniref:restriction endonuclease subunit S n=1 Tax=Streptococcus gordonii TaxID=1302 RepID=UPI0009C24C64|nr:restriction endonuclease subunit S [Streptococcus gordonii]ARC47845.1 restriction endonuclease subunit S [Streptococcus gordonii]RSJ50491.1 EcoKI restriction-modification system protein HsdS [Streptococcus gordonii]RSJ60058.1 EcoKI restriction-modification system protein HsdS [Streptococcus gordonii]